MTPLCPECGTNHFPYEKHVFRVRPRNGQCSECEVKDRQIQALKDELERWRVGTSARYGESLPGIIPPACPRTKQGEFNPLRCVLDKGHDGECNWVVAGPSWAEQYAPKKPKFDKSAHMKEVWRKRREKT